MVRPIQLQTKHTTPARSARNAVLQGQPIDAVTVAQLEALGVNVGELEERIRQSMELRH